MTGTLKQLAESRVSLAEASGLGDDSRHVDGSHVIVLGSASDSDALYFEPTLIEAIPAT